MTTLLTFIVTLGVLVLVHEYGHFIVARRCGVRVLRFSIGFGKVLWRTQDKHNTEFTLCAIPLGGYVRMLEEGGHDAFPNKPIGQRMLIMLAGSAANILFAIVLYWGLLMSGTVGYKPIVGEVTPQSMAWQAGMRSGELVQSVNTTPVHNWQEVHWEITQAVIRHEPFTLHTQKPTHVSAQYAMHIQDSYTQDVLKALGIAKYEPPITPKIHTIIPHSPAQKAGLQVGDTIISINQTIVQDWKQVVELVRKSPENNLDILLQRGEKTYRYSIVPSLQKNLGQSVGYLGASAVPSQMKNLLTTVRYHPTHALPKALDIVWGNIILNLKLISGMVLGYVSWHNISGPISIANYADWSWQMGIQTFVYFLALLSISIGVLNLLPIPMLDGGHLLYEVLALLRGKPLPTHWRDWGYRVGFLLLIGIFVLALYNDFKTMIN